MWSLWGSIEAANTIQAGNSLGKMSEHPLGAMPKVVKQRLSSVPTEYGRPGQAERLTVRQRQRRGVKEQIAVVIPSYRVSTVILNVIRKIGPEVVRIYVIDDCCPDQSGSSVQSICKDERVTVIRHQENQGVGGAVMTGYQKAIDDGMDIIVKVDGDDQMDASLIPSFVSPIIVGEADYTKGNRFFYVENTRAMPSIRLFGNTVLSFLTKVSSGYWDVFDPTNGFTAIHRDVAQHLPFQKISRRYFFETDMLFRLNTLRAVVMDVPMEAKYGGELSNVRINKIIGEFLLKHLRNFLIRVFYNYYLRDMSLASIELPVGLIMFVFGTVFGSYHWVRSILLGVSASAGTVMVASLSVILGLQFILAFLSYDIRSVPQKPVHRALKSIGES